MVRPTATYWIILEDIYLLVLFNLCVIGVIIDKSTATKSCDNNKVSNKFDIMLELR